MAYGGNVGVSIQTHPANDEEHRWGANAAATLGANARFARAGAVKPAASKALMKPAASQAAAAGGAAIAPGAPVAPASQAPGRRANGVLAANNPATSRPKGGSRKN